MLKKEKAFIDNLQDKEEDDWGRQQNSLEFYHAQASSLLTLLAQCPLGELDRVVQCRAKLDHILPRDIEELVTHMNATVTRQRPLDIPATVHAVRAVEYALDHLYKHVQVEENSNMQIRYQIQSLPPIDDIVFEPEIPHFVMTNEIFSHYAPFFFRSAAGQCKTLFKALEDVGLAVDPVPDLTLQEPERPS